VFVRVVYWVLHVVVREQEWTQWRFPRSM